MKKYFLLAAAAATVLAVSCNKEKNQPTTDPTPQIEDNTPQPIRFGTNIAEVKAPITKAAIENTGWGAGQTLYVYGFRLDNNGAPTISDAGVYINKVGADAPATFTNNGVRKAINVYEDATNHYPYYYESGESYSFFGYYVGSATANPAIDEGKVTAAVEIDGTNDIMLATTDKFDDYLYASAQPGANITVSIDEVYNEVSARQGVVPDLKFKHQLARFKFETKYGGNGNYDDINIVKLQMMSPKAGTLTIASANEDDLGFVTTGQWGTPTNVAADAYGFTADNSFTLKNAAGDADATGNPGNGVFAPFGESIMTFPQGLDVNNNDASPKYHLLLTLTQAGRYQPGSTTNLQQFTVPMDIDFSKVVDANGAPIINKYAEAGKMYVIRLVIYGAEQIDMTVSLEDWEYGGETEIDPDQDTRPATTITVKDKDDAAALTAINIAINESYDHIIATATYASTPTPTNIAAAAILFASSNKKVATVDGTGKVTAVGAGNCKIYVYVNGTDDYQGALAAVDVTVTGGIAIPLPVATFAVTPSTDTWAWDANATSGAAVATISTATATYNATDVTASFTVTYSVEDNPYFAIDGNSGAVTLKQDMSAVTPVPTADVTVTFTATFTDGVTYQSGTKDFTITVDVA